MWCPLCCSICVLTKAVCTCTRRFLVSVTFLPNSGPKPIQERTTKRKTKQNRQVQPDNPSFIARLKTCSSWHQQINWWTSQGPRVDHLLCWWPHMENSYHLTLSYKRTQTCSLHGNRLIIWRRYRLIQEYRPRTLCSYLHGVFKTRENVNWLVLKFLDVTQLSNFL